ncbi:hypothetical protein AB832_01920 [Flavobacteriaceae bacterium (ex Bugula neritina AB1)]|nr:hypothetical protein AB832_01920 [Flavobacteriaceae bacterium (ex Bugula neritina AB1)]
MNLDFNLDFLYYQEKAILDARDPKMKELDPHISKFTSFFKNEPLMDILKLISKMYKNMHPQEKYLYRGFLIEDAYKINLEYPDYVDEESDLYIADKKLNRLDLKHVFLKRFDDAANNAYFLKEMELAFVSSQDHTAIADGIEEELKEVVYRRLDAVEEITFEVENSPIASIKISRDAFNMFINPDKWVRYFRG